MITEKALKEFFKTTPTPSLVLLVNAPAFTILEVNNAYLEVTHSKPEDLIGKGIFQAFPENKNDPNADGIKNLTASLNAVINTKKSHKMAIQKHDIPIWGTSQFKIKYWEPVNIPLLDQMGKVTMIVHTVMDVTGSVLSDLKNEESKLIIEKGNETLALIETISKLGRWEIELATQKVHWFDSYYEMLGYKPQEFELSFEKLLEIIHPDDHTRVLSYYQNQLIEQKEYKIEYRLITKSKTVIDIVSRAKFIYDKQGNLLKLVGVQQDITDIKRAEASAKKTQQELQKIMDLSLDIICTVDGNGKFLQVSQACILILGYTPEELVGKSYREFIFQDDYIKTKEVESNAHLGVEIKNFENTYIRKEGTLVPLIWSAHWQESDKTMYCVAKDATILKNAEKQVLERQAFIETALENLPIGIAINKIDDNNTVWMNKKFIEIYGWPEELLKDISNFFKKVYPDKIYRKEISSRIKDGIKSGNKDLMNWENLIITSQNGQQKNINAKNIPVHDQNLMISTVVDITEKVNAQKTIEESNERFQYATKATFDAIWDWDLATDTIYWAQGFETIFGHKKLNFKNNSSSWINNIHPTDLQRITDSFYKIIKSTENNWIEEYRFKNGNGTYSYVINKGIIIREPNKRAKRIIGAMHNISKRKQEEQRLKLLESVITNATDSVLITDAEPLDYPGPKILFVNEAFTKMTGYTAQEVIGKTPRMLQGPKTDKEELNKLSVALHKWETCEVTLLNYKKSGEEFWLNMSITPVADETGKFTHLIAIERDVTERINQEQKLAEINQKLFNTLESIQDGFYTLDNNWQVSYWNYEAERISGKSQQEVMGKNIWEVYEGKISKKIYSRFHTSKEQNLPIRLEIYSKILKGWFELNAFPSNMGLTVYFKDITERKKTESKLKKINRTLEVHIKELAVSNQELEQFAYVASHDLQEPLRMITGFLTQIEKKYESILDEKGKKYIYFAVDGAKRMRQIILDLLEFSRIGKNENTLEEINLNVIIDEIVLLFENQIKEKNVNITCKNLPKIVTYATPLKQIFQNLISNSLKYSKVNTPPVISISSQETALEWKFKIQDNGIGIESEYFDKIFVIFQRLHNKDEYSGTGIGLAITKKIVENMGGQIWVESKEGKGSTFYFTIPKKQIKKS